MYLAQCIMTTKAQFKTSELLSLVPWQIDCHNTTTTMTTPKDKANDKQSEAHNKSTKTITIVLTL